MRKSIRVLVVLAVVLAMVVGVAATAYGLTLIGTYGPGKITAVSSTQFTVSRYFLGIRVGSKSFKINGSTIGRQNIAKNRNNTYVTYGIEYLTPIAGKVW